MAPTATENLDELERQHRGQLLGLGALALELHQNGELDEHDSYKYRSGVASLMRLAAQAAETERRLSELRGA